LKPERVKVPEEKPTPAGSGRAAAGYSYPGELARFVRDRWGNDVEGSVGGVNPLPDAAALEGFFAACYQASMLREEERQVVFRAIFAEPVLFDPEGRPPEALQRLAFPRSLPFDPRELRRLSMAADQQRTLIGVLRDGEGGLRIRFLEEGKTVFAYANNHYENHAPSTLEQLVEIRRGR
jgi:hypothetical protein